MARPDDQTQATVWDQARIDRAAEFVWRAHRDRRPFENIPPDIAPGTIDQAYDVQEAFHRRMIPTAGAIAGLKIATTTKVMQQLVGIDHPCGGAIFASRILASPASLGLADFIHLMAECELAVRLGRDLADGGAISREQAMAATAGVAPAFELVEDRHAVHRETKATSLIADNAWNAGIVHGAWCRFDPAVAIADIEGVLTVDGAERGRGRLDDPFGALAWVAMLAVRRKRPLRAGMVVITGSIVPTFPLAAGGEVRFRLDPWGETRMRLA